MTRTVYEYRCDRSGCRGATYGRVTDYRSPSEQAAQDDGTIHSPGRCPECGNRRTYIGPKVITL